MINKKSCKLISAILALYFLILSSPQTAQANKLIKENDRFPNFNLSLLKQSTTKINLAKILKEKPKLIILDFWASWCGPCAQAMPVLEGLHKTYKSKGLKIIGVNVDENLTDGQGFAEKINVSFPLIYDSKQSLSNKIKVKTMPSSYILDSKGKVIHVHKGFRDGDKKKYEDLIKKYIR